jgi:hypothetical protein
MEGTSDFALAMEWYLKYGEREITIEKRTEDYPQGSNFSTGGVAYLSNGVWKITTKALKVIREHHGTNAREKGQGKN